MLWNNSVWNNLDQFNKQLSIFHPGSLPNIWFPLTPQCVWVPKLQPWLSSKFQSNISLYCEFLEDRNISLHSLFLKPSSVLLVRDQYIQELVIKFSTVFWKVTSKTTTSLFQIVSLSFYFSLVHHFLLVTCVSNLEVIFIRWLFSFPLPDRCQILLIFDKIESCLPCILSSHSPCQNSILGLH